MWKEGGFLFRAKTPSISPPTMSPTFLQDSPAGSAVDSASMVNLQGQTGEGKREERENKKDRGLEEYNARLVPVVPVIRALVGDGPRGGVPAGDPAVGRRLADDVEAQVGRLVHDVPPLGRHRVVLPPLEQAQREALPQELAHARVWHGVVVDELHCPE